MTMADLTPQSISSRGVITATDADGTRHHFHTDATEARQFAAAAMCLAAGRNELFLLLYSNDSPYHASLRREDGRTDEQLKADWLTKVCGAGLSQAAALQFLNARLACE